MTSDLDFENWMTNLSDAARNIPIIYLAIPGSHDSAMTTVQRFSPTAPDGPPWISSLYKIMPCMIKKWVRTQNNSLVDQLKHGIRYFDLRIAWFHNEFRVCHGLYSPSDISLLEGVNEFLEEHPKEFLILDLQHVYNCDQSLMASLGERLTKIFGTKICMRKEYDLEHCTLNNMTSKSLQVLIIFRDFADDSGVFYNNQWPTPWPNKTKTKDLIPFLEGNINNRNRGEGYVTQCVLTPDMNFILSHLFGSIKRTCATAVLSGMLDWIRQRHCGLQNWPSYNVFIADYVLMQDDAFIAAVLSINDKLEKELEACKVVNMDDLNHNSIEE